MKQPKITMSNPAKNKGCAGCGLIEQNGQPVTLIIEKTGFFANLAVCTNCSR